MPNEIVEKVLSLVDEIQLYKNYKNKFIESITNIDKKLNEGKITKEKYDQLLSQLLKGKTKEQSLNTYANYINYLLDKILIQISLLEKSLTQNIKKQDEIKAEEVYIRETFLKRKSKKKELTSNIPYTLYEINDLGRISNQFVEKLTIKLTSNYPQFFQELSYSLKVSGIKILSKTYISIMIFLTICSSMFFFLLALAFLKDFILFRIAKALMLSLVLAISTFFAVYYYPLITANSIKGKIKNDLPFVIIHMAAVAGSGAQPISMFNLILSSEEYQGIKGEIKKIVNYVNLFGYDLSTALKAVASATPSKEFKELLNGIVTTIETGGSLKEYLDAKAEDALTTYRLDRKKYVETVATYSDVYTGLLIAAPLLFFVTLAIIQGIGGAIGGISANTIATVGTFLVIPLFNLGFIIFLNTIQLE